MTQLMESTAGQFDRLPPSSIEAEMCLIASMMLDRTCIPGVIELIEAEDFFQADHQILFDVLCAMYQASAPIDALLVREELIKRGTYEEIGGREYLGTLLSKVPSAAHAIAYANVIHEKATLRRLISASNEMLRDAYAPHTSAGEVLEESERRMMKVLEKSVGGSASMAPIGKVAVEVYDRMQTSTGTRGVPTGYFELDELLSGLQDGDLVIVAARPSIGKTALALNIAEHITGESALPCAVFSMEMGKDQLAQRMICSRGRIDFHRYRKGMLSLEEHQQVANVVAEMQKMPLWVDDATGLTLMRLSAKAQKMKARHDIKAVIVDYLQLMEQKGAESRQQAVSEISRGLKSLARDLKVPVIALSQLNRSTEGREGHRPRLSDLRESGAIEQDADVVLLLHREDYYHQGEADFQPDNIAEVIVAKQRNGPTGVVKLAFLPAFTRFENLSQQADPYA
jgi:replicative DNA helicase